MYDRHIHHYRKAQPLTELASCRASLWQAQWKFRGYNRLIHKIAARGCIMRARRVRLGV